ncbi:MAG TPA: primosomal protein N', partial [Syntrophomonadaceae bacterium]|nr:primosomal protein N' [Syntrophomonadaceae bacterium]
MQRKGGAIPAFTFREKIKVNYANVLVNLPSIALNQVFTYAIPERFKGKIELGQRVLVEFGSNRLEAYVIALQKETKVGNVKNIIHVLDNKAIINQELLKIAYFMADNYLCPISTALNAMVPKAITKSRAQVIIPMIEIEDFNQMSHLEHFSELFYKLWQDNEITLAASKSYLKDGDLEYLSSLGVIKVINKYRQKPAKLKGYVYSLNVEYTQSDIEKLVKRAPKQAEILQALLKNNIACECLEKKYNKNSIKTLLNRQVIVKKLVPTKFMDSKIKLTSAQAEAIKTVNNALSKGNQEYLLFGVTGSGKTEVYMHIAQHYIENGKTVLMLIPEIALTRHLVDVVSLRISNIAVLHSNMSNGERLEEWERIKNGDVSLVLGTRSAIFAPLSNLGLIIIDEEQENTYKQEETPKYDAKEIAKKRALYNDAIILYGSATPSLELFYRVQNNEVFMLKLESRVGDAELPEFHIEDLRLSKKLSADILSPYLRNRILQKLEKKEQTILFINRRGYSPITLCNKCGEILTCPYCSVGLNYHQDLHANICHYCDYKTALSENCPKCGSKQLIQTGTGTQKVETEVKRLFPHAVVERLDLDVSRKGMQEKLLQSMGKRQIDILIGTQMVAKGLDFPNVSLVGIVDADSMLALPDYRAAERTFQLIVQAAGRAGRGGKVGEVVIQTYSPENPIIGWAAEQNYIKFYFEEIKLR